MLLESDDISGRWYLSLIFVLDARKMLIDIILNLKQNSKFNYYVRVIHV